MAIKHIPDDGGFEFPSDFGFHGATSPGTKTASGSNKTLAKGKVSVPPRVGHPHGEMVMRTVNREDGGCVQYHAHGGHTVVHADGMTTHHMHDGTPVGMPVPNMAQPSIENTHDISEYVHRPKGTSVKGPDMMTRRDGGSTSPTRGAGPGKSAPPPSDSDKQRTADEMNNVWSEQGRADAYDRQDAADQRGDVADSDNGYRGGGRVKIPRDMKIPQSMPKSPINTPPRNPTTSVSMKNDMPGGEMAYGVQPGTESSTGLDGMGTMPSPGEMTPYRRGGRVKK